MLERYFAYSFVLKDDGKMDRVSFYSFEQSKNKPQVIEWRFAQRVNNSLLLKIGERFWKTKKIASDDIIIFLGPEYKFIKLKNDRFDSDRIIVYR